MAQIFGMVGRTSISRTYVRVRSLRLPRGSLWVNKRSLPLDDLFQYSSPRDRLLQSYTALSSVLSARCFISTEVAHLVAIWLHWRQTSQQQYRHVQEKTHIKVIITKISHIFHQELHDPNHQFVKSPSLVVGSLRALICVLLMRFNEDDTLATISCINTQRSVLITA